MDFAPVALFVFNRPFHAWIALESLKRNPEAEKSDLWVFADGPRGSADEENVKQTRAVFQQVSGFRSVHFFFNEHNAGLSKQIISGVNQVLRDHDRIIVLEDDLLLSPHFLAYMNDGLKMYAFDSLVASIHGYVYPVSHPLPETFFVKGADCWGWATWKRSWENLETDGRKLQRSLQKRGLIPAFTYEGRAPFKSVLSGQIKGRNDSWAILWHASIFKRGGLTLYPGRPLVRNIGFGSGGTHCYGVSAYDHPWTPDPIRVVRLPLVESLPGREEFGRFFGSIRAGPFSKLVERCFPSLGVLRQFKKLIETPFNAFRYSPWVGKLKNFLGRGDISFLGPYSDWGKAQRHSAGYSAPEIVESIFSVAQKVHLGEAVFQRDGFVLPEEEYSLPLLALLLKVLQKGRRVAHVLDFGGGFGSVLPVYQKLLGSTNSLEWRIVEQASFVEKGRQNFEHERLHFYPDIPAAMRAGPVDIALLSSVLQYLENSSHLFAHLKEARIPFIMIDKTPFSNDDREDIFVQTVPPNMRAESYPCRFISRTRLKTALAPEYQERFFFDCTETIPTLSRFGAIYRGGIFQWQGEGAL